jgi:hypothetical protein
VPGSWRFSPKLSASPARPSRDETTPPTKAPHSDGTRVTFVDDFYAALEHDREGAIEFALHTCERAVSDAMDEEFDAVAAARAAASEAGAVAACLEAAEEVRMVAVHYARKRRRRDADTAWSAYHVARAFAVEEEPEVRRILLALRHAAAAAESPQDEQSRQEDELRQLRGIAPIGKRLRLSPLAAQGWQLVSHSVSMLMRRK